MVKEFQDTMGRKVERIPDKTMNALTSYHWPGNVRELRNVIERAMILTTGTTLEIRMPDAVAGQQVSRGTALQDVEREHITSVLMSTGWRITGKGGAAGLLGLKGTTLYSKMKKLGIMRPAP
jgi:transcriptional regulator of acetoin/glycerol metabolism